MAMACADDSQAAILVETPDDAHCDFLLQGEIVTGDANLVETAVPANHAGVILCMNSPGGDFVESLSLFYTIWNKDSIITRVRPDAECFSACAFAFLGGSRVVGTGLVRTAARIIDPGGVLGFHAPQIIAPEGGTYSSEYVQASYALALSDVANLFALTLLEENGVAGMQPFIFNKIIQTLPEELFLVDTVGRASLSGISIPYSAPPEFSKSSIENICTTAFIMANRRLLQQSIETSFHQVRHARRATLRTPNQEADSVIELSDTYRTRYILRGYPSHGLNSEEVCVVSVSNLMMSRMSEVGFDAYLPDIGYGVTFMQGFRSSSAAQVQEYLETSHSSSETFRVPWYSTFDPGLALEDMR